MRAGGVVLVGMLLFLSSVAIFAPAEHERDHEPAGAETEPHESLAAARGSVPSSNAAH